MTTDRPKLNILIIPGIFPFPPIDGGKICIYSFIDSLRHVQNIHLLLPIYDIEQLKAVESMKETWDNVQIHTVKEYTFKLNNIVKNETAEKLKKTYKKVINILPGVSSLTEGNFPFKSVASYLYKKVTPAYSLNFIKALIKLLNEIKFDIVQMEHTPTLNLVNVFPQEIKKIFVEIESHHLMVREYGNTTDIDKDYINYISKNIKDVELSYMRKFDAIFTLSEVDRERLQNDLPDLKVYLSPYPVLDADISNEVLPQVSTKNIVFMGNEGHQSNRDAVFWFTREILPLIDSNNFANLYITGVWTEETIKEITALNSKIIFTGFLENLKSLLANSISIVPIRLGGGGMRTKIIYAMASNSAVITTSLGATGIVGKNQKDFLIADTKEEFSGALNNVLTDQTLYEKLILNGKTNIQQNYSQTILTKKRNQFYYEIIKK